MGFFFFVFFIGPYLALVYWLWSHTVGYEAARLALLGGSEAEMRRPSGKPGLLSTARSALAGTYGSETESAGSSASLNSDTTTDHGAATAKPKRVGTSSEPDAP